MNTVELVKTSALKIIGPFTTAGLRQRLPAKLRIMPWELEDILRSMPEIKKLNNEEWVRA